MNQKDIDLKTRVEQFRDLGFTIFERVYDAAKIATLRALYDRLKEEELGTELKGDYLIKEVTEQAPRTMLPISANPLILDFAEMVMGPFVQISDSVLFGFASREKADNRVNGWHRDRYAQVPRGGYQNPVGLTVLCYLQDMTEESGPLRIIPRSHRLPILLEDEEKQVPHKDDMVVPLKAGDVIAFHSALLHTGSPNWSGRERIFVGGQYNCTWMKHVDNHNGPNVRRIVREAKARNDHRTMRLFGVDEQLEQRINSGFRVADDIRWAEWSAADKAAIVSAN